MSKNKRDYHAKLIIHDLADMKSVTYRRLVEWLADTVKELKKAKVGDYSNLYTKKLMK